MASTTLTGSRPRDWRRSVFVVAPGATLLAFTASPSLTNDYDGYVGDPDAAPAFWSTISEADLRACIAVHGAHAGSEDLGDTPLYVAAAHSDNPAVIAMLVEAGAELRRARRPWLDTAARGSDWKR